MRKPYFYPCTALMLATYAAASNSGSRLSHTEPLAEKIPFTDNVHDILPKAIVGYVTHSMGVSCLNCSATTTPIWRKLSEADFMCNACAIYKFIHSIPPKHPQPTSASQQRPITPNPRPIASAQASAAVALGECLLIQFGERRYPVAVRGFVWEGGKLFLWLLALELRKCHKILGEIRREDVVLGSEVVQAVSTSSIYSRLKFSLFPRELQERAPASSDQCIICACAAFPAAAAVPAFSLPPISGSPIGPQQLPSFGEVFSAA